MALPFSLPEGCKIVQLAQPQTSNGGVTTDVVSLKNVLKAWLIVEMTQAVGHATQIVPREATDVAAGTNQVLQNVQRIWANEDVAASDTLVAKTAAKNYSVTNDVKNKTVVFEIDPALMDVEDGYDCLYATISDSSQATNFVSVTAILHQRYQQATPPAAITD